MYGYKLGLKKVGESVPAAPANVVQPLLSGSGAVDTVVTSSSGTWTGFPTPTFNYDFKLNTVSVQSGASNTFTPGSINEGETLTVTVTATNSQGSVNADSSNSLVVGSVPLNTVAPTIFGDNTFGSTLTTTDGTFTGTAPITYTYQWQRGGSPISGQTANTYVIGSSDSLANITCVVTGTNSYGFDSEVSNTITVENFAPVNTVAPTVSPSGTQSTGTLITANSGTWTGVAPITFEYKWTRDGIAISGATASTYTIQLADDGTTIRVEVKGTNAYGVSAFVASSNSVSAVNTVAPTNSVAPVISGTAVVGQTLTSTTGTWNGIPTPTYSYQWKRGATNIGTNSSTYTLVQADAGNTSNITCVVTATNAGGSANATSNQIAQVLDSDASSFFTAMALTNSTIIDAENNFFIDRKNISTLTNSLGSYHFVTDKSTNTDRLGQFKFNAYNPVDTNGGKRLTYGGTITANTTGLQGSVNGFANTFINTSTDFTSNNFTIFFVINTNVNTGIDFGNSDGAGAGLWTISKFSDNNTYYGAYTGSASKGNIIATTKAIYSYKRSGNTVTLKKNNVTLFTDNNPASVSRLNYSLYLLARNFNGTAQLNTTREYSFFEFVNAVLTSTQETDFYNALVTREAALGR